MSTARYVEEKCKLIEKANYSLGGRCEAYFYVLMAKPELTYFSDTEMSLGMSLFITTRVALRHLHEPGQDLT